ncbi:MAG: acetyl-CoA carboxylase biotin carboxyl carrier protein subunit, partial [Gammaproteobacteria bacterium]
VAAAWWLAHAADNTPRRAGLDVTGAVASPWTTLRGWRLNQSAQEKVRLSTIAQDSESEPFDVEVGIVSSQKGAVTYKTRVLGSEMTSVTFGRRDSGNGTNVFPVEVHTGHRRRWLSAGIRLDADRLHIRWRVGLGYLSGQFRVHSRDSQAASVSDAAGHLLAPMPGKVTHVFVSAGQQVEAGQALMVLEAMKMEHNIVAPHAGEIAVVFFGVGDLAAEGEELVSLAQTS